LYVRVPLDGGGEFVVESAAQDTGTTRVGRGDHTVASSAQTFESSMSTVKHIAEVVVQHLSQLAVAPSRFTAEFGIALSAEAGMAVVKGKGEAHFVIQIEWSKDSAGKTAEPAAQDGTAGG
jgi:hypothetical protein